MNSEYVDAIAKACFAQFDNIARNRKLNKSQWTVMSAVVKLDTQNKSIQVITIGAGSKCIGASKMSSKGDILNDSHAEVFARRGFLLYLIDQIQKCIKEELSIFIKINHQFRLKDTIEFAFFSSQLPCGDACIVPKSIDNYETGELVPHNKKMHMGNNAEDIHRTGAKCLPYGNKDPKQPGIMYHTVGEVRYKPGRGDPTLSVSCSDKLARWNYVGAQGALLDLLLEKPIYFKYYIFGNGVPFNEEALQRALITRNRSNYADFLKNVPQFYQSSIKFSGICDDNSKKPAAESIVWVDARLHEVAIQGKRLGTTKKNYNSDKSSLTISKVKLFTQFLKVIKSDPSLYDALLPKDGQFPCYLSMKLRSLRYYDRWNLIKNEVFGIWTYKPKTLLEFNVSELLDKLN